MSAFKALSEELEKQSKAKDSLIENQLKKITSLEESLRLNTKHTYGSKSQKRKSTKTDDDDPTKNKDGFDGTPDSLNSPPVASTGIADKQSESSEKKEKEVRLYRQGKEYRTMRADKSVFHGCDVTKLPAGSQIIKCMHRYS